MNQSQNPNLMENVFQKVINQIKEIENETEHIKDSKPIKTTIQNTKKKKISSHNPKYSNIQNRENPTNIFKVQNPTKPQLKFKHKNIFMLFNYSINN